MLLTGGDPLVMRTDLLASLPGAAARAGPGARRDDPDRNEGPVVLAVPAAGRTGGRQPASAARAADRRRQARRDDAAPVARRRSCRPTRPGRRCPGWRRPARCSVLRPRWCGTSTTTRSTWADLWQAAGPQRRRAVLHVRRTRHRCATGTTACRSPGRSTSTAMRCNGSPGSGGPRGVR